MTLRVSVNQCQSVSGLRCILILHHHHHHYPSPYCLIQSFTFLQSIYYTFTLLKFYFCHCYCTYYHTPYLYTFIVTVPLPVSLGYSPLSAPSPHSLTHCVRACDELVVSHPCLASHCNPTKSGTGYRRAHTLSRSLRDRQLAATCHTPPPTLLGLATVQNEKSHIPPRQAVTHHYNASRLAP